jgi:competence protein ComEA
VPNPSVARVAAIVAALALVGVSAFLAGRRGLSTPRAIVPVEVVGEPSGSLTVHVAGAVAAPGLVEVGPGARLADAVVAAGGATPDADLAAVNLAAPVDDGAQVVIPSRSDGDGPSAPPGDGRIRLNHAPADELTTLPGIGPVLAQRIVDHRDDVGRFERVEDLLEVSGIGERLLAGIRDLVVVP